MYTRKCSSVNNGEILSKRQWISIVVQLFILQHFWFSNIAASWFRTRNCYNYYFSKWNGKLFKLTRERIFCLFWIFLNFHGLKSTQKIFLREWLNLIAPDLADFAIFMCGSDFFLILFWFCFFLEPENPLFNHK